MSLAHRDLVLAIFGEFSDNPKTYFQRDQLFEGGELFRVLFDALRDGR